MIKSIENASSSEMNLDSFLFKLKEQDVSTNQAKKGNKTHKQSTDEFKKGFDIRDMESKVSELLEDNSLIAKFSTDKETEKLILKLIDKETGEVVRQYPPEITLKIARMVNNIIENDNLENVRI